MQTVLLLIIELGSHDSVLFNHYNIMNVKILSNGTLIMEILTIQYEVMKESTSNVITISFPQFSSLKTHIIE